jgi:hypothetical protein
MAELEEGVGKMVWHIFKKDWKLLWSFVAAVALLHGIAALIMFKLGLFNEDPTLEMLSYEVPNLAVFGSMFLIVAIVHLEAIPGVRQDWLTRPIPRRSLLLEKLLFVVITVEGPIFALSLAQGLAFGFSWRSSLLAAAAYVALLFFFLILPIFSFASVTRNMTEAFILGCGCTLIIGAFLLLSSSMNQSAHGTLIAVTHSGIGWIGEVCRFALVTVAAGVILGSQYFRRKTVWARFFVVVFGSLLLVSTFLPWRPVFAIEERLSSKPGASAGVEMTFNSLQERYKSPSGLPASAQNRQRREDDAEVFLPLQVAGVRNDAILLVDHVEVQLIGQDGRVLYHGAGEPFEFAREGPKPPEVPIYQQMAIPMSLYSSAKDQAVQVRVDYSLTLFGLGRSYAMPSLDGDERMPGWGWCKTKMNEAGTAVELHCIEPGKGPMCASAFLENASSGAQNPPRSSCESEYRPFGDKPTPDNFARFGGNLPFRDPSGLAKFPVDGSQLPQSRVVIRNYEPEEHFTRSLVIPQIKLRDWGAQ